MSKYRVRIKSFVNNSIAEEGAVVEYDGKPGDNLEPMDADAQQAVDEAGKGLDVMDMTRQKVAAIGGDPDAIELAQAATAAAAAAEATLQGKAVIVDGKVIEPNPTPPPAGADGLV